MFTNYNNFIYESKLQLLIEANIAYSSRFLDTISKIDSPISNKLIIINGKDYNVDRNYIDINVNKIDSVFFKSQDKIDKANYYIINPNDIYYALSKSAESIGSIGKFASPDANQIGVIAKEFTLDELCKISPGNSNVWTVMYENGNIFIVFQFILDDTTYNVITKKNNIVKNIKSVTNVEVNIGRFVRAFLSKIGYKFTDKEVENFVDQYKKVIQIESNILSEFKEITGNDIKKYYLESSYESITGSLGGSCMRHNFCQDFFDIYTENPDKVSLVILPSKEDSLKISGRAILWLDNSGRYIMDRIYTIRTADILIFKDYCISKGYYYKEEQSFSSNQLVFNNKELDDSRVFISLRKIKYEYFPYMDTMKYYSPTTGTLSNAEPKKNTFFYVLNETDGTSENECDICQGSGITDCPECDGTRTLDCNDCDGTIGNDCESCGGYGIEDCFNCMGRGEVGCPNCT